ncbi:MAG: hypothetical protein IJM59_07740 [Proteobacteria bacterium]|nr:hypothetical protein [Pseudomonadota bacterium]
MAKKKRQEKDSYEDFQQENEPLAPDEEPLDEDEESDDGESEDVFAEDESDIAMIRKLEEEDTQIALSEILFDEEVGFNPMFDWSTVSEAERSRFAALKTMSREDVEAYSWKRLSAFQRWMVARACSLCGLHEMFREIALGIIKARKRPPELCIEDIFLELVWDYVETKEYPQALELVDKFEQSFPDEQAAALRVRGLIYIDMGESDKGKALIDQLIHLPFNRNIKGFEDDKSSRDSDKRDGVIQYEIGYALLNMKRYDLALHYFERARNLANMNDDYELTMSIDNARAETLRNINGDD